LGDAKPGVVGYCFGGSVAWWAAIRSDYFAAASCWYGGEIVLTAAGAAPRCPVQMHFAELDSHIAMEDVGTIRDAQPQIEIHVYIGANHGFGCDERSSFHESSYRLAQQRTVEFLTRLLG